MSHLLPAELREFRAELEDWFLAHRPGPLASPYTPEGLQQHLAWERTLFEAGYGAPGWPTEVGGMGLDAWGQLVFDEVYVGLDLPERLNKMGFLHGGPTIIAHGTPEQQRRWLPGILSSERIWCQGFSEPEAGSDLASLRATARVEGDHLVINGQKTWTSQGTIASTMFGLFRTSPDKPRNRGISFVVVDLDTPGVEVRPLRQMHGHDGFAEVFFDEVRVPRENVVGALDDGWRVAQTSLQLERGSGRGNHTKLWHAVTELAEDIAADTSRDAGPSISRLGSLSAWADAYQRATYAMTGSARSEVFDASFYSVMKLEWTELQTATHEAHLEYLGADAEFLSPARERGDHALTGLWRRYWYGRAAEIYAGSSQIQKNIIAEQMLGLPREGRR